MECFLCGHSGRHRVLSVRHHNREEASVTPFLQLLVAAGVAISGTFIALWIDKKEHCDSRQTNIHFPERRNDDEHEHRGVAMSRLR